MCLVKGEAENDFTLFFVINTEKAPVYTLVEGVANELHFSMGEIA